LGVESVWLEKNISRKGAKIAKKKNGEGHMPEAKLAASLSTVRFLRVLCLLCVLDLHGEDVSPHLPVRLFL
jgi:hypothetical protein